MKYHIANVLCVGGVGLLLGTASSVSAASAPGYHLLPAEVRLMGGSSTDYGRGIAWVAGQERLYACGMSASTTFEGLPLAGGADIFVSLHDPALTPLWMHLVGGSGDDYCQGAAVDQQGNGYFVGHTTSATLDGQQNAGAWDSVLVKFDLSGNKLWTRLLGGTGNEWGLSVAVDSQGDVLITGYSDSPAVNGQTSNGGEDVFLAKYDASGTLLWSTLVGGTGHDWGRGVAVDSADNILVGGWTSSPDWAGAASLGDKDFLVAKFAPSGNLLWVSRFGGSGADTGIGMAVDRAGWCVLVGLSTSPTIVDQTNRGAHDFMTARVSPSGDLDWVRLLGASRGDTGVGVTIAPDHTILATGYCESRILGEGIGDGNYSAVVTAYDPQGNRHFTQLHAGSGADHGTALALDEEGRVYFIGSSSSPTLSGVQGRGDYDALLSVWTPPGLRPCRYGDLYAELTPSRDMVLWLRACNSHAGATATSATAYAAVEIQGTFYFIPTLSTNAAPIAELPLPVGLEMPFVEVFRLPGIWEFSPPLVLTWYFALIEQGSGELLGGLHSYRHAIE